MAIIYKTTDKLPVKIGDITFKISPLSFEHRSLIQADLSLSSKGDLSAAGAASFKAIKYAVKSIEGVETLDDSKYELEFDGKELKDECVNNLLNLEVSLDLIRVALSLLGGVPDKIVDEHGKPVKGITLLYKKTSSKKK